MPQREWRYPARVPSSACNSYGLCVISGSLRMLAIAPDLTPSPLSYEERGSQSVPAIVCDSLVGM